jgi:hypothetical protein
MEENVFGILFETIKLENENHLEIILQTMDKNSATYILTQAISYAYKRGAYSLGESEVISKALRVLNKTEETLESN